MSFSVTPCRTGRWARVLAVWIGIASAAVALGGCATAGSGSKGAGALTEDRLGWPAGEAFEPSVSLWEVELFERGMTIDELRRVEQRLEDEHRPKIRGLEQRIDARPDAPDHPQWVFRQAELLREVAHVRHLRRRAEYQRCRSVSRREGDDTSRCLEPQPDYDRALDNYGRLLQRHPRFERLDVVIFRFGQIRMASAEGAEAVNYLQELTLAFPRSDYVDEAGVLMGDFFFHQEMFVAARNRYENAINPVGGNQSDYARYKLAWVDCRTDARDKCVERMKSVAEERDFKGPFARLVLHDLVAIHHHFDRDLKAFRAYLERQDETPAVRHALEQL